MSSFVIAKTCQPLELPAKLIDHVISTQGGEKRVASNDHVRAFKRLQSLPTSHISNKAVAALTTPEWALLSPLSPRRGTEISKLAHTEDIYARLIPLASCELIMSPVSTLLQIPELVSRIDIAKHERHP